MVSDKPQQSRVRTRLHARLQKAQRLAQEVKANPRSSGTLLAKHLRQTLIAVWIRHGAGFYGLGWICCFVFLEVQLFTTELEGSDGVLEFIGGQFIEYLFRVGILSFVNTFLALLWPAYILQWLDGYGFIVLLGGYLLFEKLLRPVVESRFPELAVARAEKAARAEEEAQAKKEAQAQKKRKRKKRSTWK